MSPATTLRTVVVELGMKNQLDIEPVFFIDAGVEGGIPDYVGGVVGAIGNLYSLLSRTLLGHRKLATSPQCHSDNN
jgi:hypothetical protein